MENTQEKTEYLRELWKAFEKTGSIGAYLLYNDLCKNVKKEGKVREKEILSKDNN